MRMTDEHKDLPDTELIEKELDREIYRDRFLISLRTTVFTLITVAAASVLVAVLLLPILRIYGSSMSGTLDGDDVVVSVKSSAFEQGDVVAFYYNNNILVKRVIAQAGECVDIDTDGNVYVDRQKLEEPYLSNKAFGETNIELPYQVPEGRIFVMGDNRSVSIDSRNTSIGCISTEQIVGRIVFRVWPLNKFGAIDSSAG